jgi:hypothetical protein
MVTPKVTKEDYELIHQVAVRAAKELGIPVMIFSMDLERVHGCGIPLRLEEMLEDHGSDFIHDVAGITQHLDRNTGQLTDGFSPRFSV